MKKNIINVLILMSILCITSCGLKEKNQRLYVNYNYDSLINETTNKKVVWPLFNNSLLSFKIGEPEKKLIAGDYLDFTYVGELKSQTTCPATIVLTGEVKSYSYHYTDVIRIDEECIEMENNKVKNINGYLYDKYIIIDSDGTYIPLNEYDSKEIYASIDKSHEEDCPEGAMCSPQIMRFGGLFSFNPRDN